MTLRALGFYTIMHRHDCGAHTLQSQILDVLLYPLQYLRVMGAGAKATQEAAGEIKGRLTAFHPNLFTYAGDSVGSHAVTVPPSYVALGRACVAEDPLQRPTFDEVLSALEVVRRDALRMKGEPSAAVASEMCVMHELEPDPESMSTNTWKDVTGVIAVKAARLPAAEAQSQRSGPGSGLGGALGGIPLGSDILGGVSSSALGGSPGSGLPTGALQGSLQSHASGGGPGSGLGGALGGTGIPLGSDVLASWSGVSSLLGGSS